MAQVVCVGDLLIDFVPTVTGTGLADAPAFVRRRRAGPPPTSPWAWPGSGVASAFMGMVGDDPFGHFLADTLAGGGRRYRAVALHHRGAHRFGLRLAAGRRRARVHVLPPPQRRHAVHARTRSTTAAIDAARALHFDSISLASDNPRASQPVRGRPGARGRPSRHLRRQPPPAALARRRLGPGRHPGRAWPRRRWSSSATTSSSS